MTPLLLLIPLAGDPAALPKAWYNPDSVAASSELYHRYADALAPRFEAAQRDLSLGGEALGELELSVLLLGPRASEELLSFYNDTRRHAAHSYLRMQAHISLLEDDSSTTFGAALDRALAGYSGRYAVQECAPASGIAAIAGPGATTRSCEGEDLNAALAGIMDKDPALLAAVDEILSIEWPATELAPKSLPALPVTGDQGWVQLGALAQALLGPRLEQHNAELEQALGPLERGLESRDPDALAKAKAARAEYELAIAKDGQVLLDALAKSLKKQGAAVGVCANPPQLGGCPGQDMTDTLMPKLSADKRLLKALR